MPLRKPGALLPLDTEILRAPLAPRRAGQATFHGFGMAKTMRKEGASRSLTAHGTLYKALGRLEELRLVSSRWEDAEAAAEGRPRRRLYELTGEGARAAEGASAGSAAARRPQLSAGAAGDRSASPRPCVAGRASTPRGPPPPARSAPSQRSP